MEVKENGVTTDGEIPIPRLLVWSGVGETVVQVEVLVDRPAKNNLPASVFWDFLSWQGLPASTNEDKKSTGARSQ